MKQLFIICSIIILVSCSVNKEEKGSLPIKKQELDKLMKEREALSIKITTLDFSHSD